MNDRPVYSTKHPGQRSAQKADGPAGAYRPSAGPIKMRLETKGRGGKAVTVLFQLTYPDQAAATAAMRAMQERFGCGATFKDQAIELRGDLRDKVEAYLSALGIKVLRAGGR